MIKDIDSLSESKQIEEIKKDAFIIGLINNPSIAVQLAAVQKDPAVVSLIKDINEYVLIVANHLNKEKEPMQKEFIANNEGMGEEEEEDSMEQDDDMEYSESPKDWLFHAVEDLSNPDARIQIMVSPKAYFETEGSQSDCESTEFIGDSMPEYLFEEMECTWVLSDVSNKMSLDEVKKDLFDLGFVESAAFSKLF